MTREVPPGVSGWLPVAVLAVAALSTGGVGPGDRLAWHLVLLAGLVVALRAGAPGAEGPARGAVVLAGTLALGAVWLPRGVLEVVSPGIVAARPDDAGWTLALRPDRLPTAIATATAAAAMVALVRARRGPVPIGAVAWATVAWAGFGALHAALGWDGLLGGAPRRAPLGPFFAPLVNPNHHGTALVAGLPFLVRAATSTTTRPLARAAFAVTAGWVLLFPLVAKSAGLVVALGAQAIVAAAWLRGPRSVLPVGGAVAVLGGGAAWAVTLRLPEWWWLSAEPRLRQWADTLALVAAHPWFGVGGGGYASAYPAFRTVGDFARFAHVHADPLEWVAQVGVVGLGLSVGVAWAARRRLAFEDPVPAVALAGVAAHALVDFPLQIPFLLLLAASLVALGLPVTRPSAPRAAWWVLLVPQALALGAHAWEVRAGGVAAAVLEGTSTLPPAVVRARAPASPAWALRALQTGADPGPVLSEARAAFAHDGAALARVAHAALVGGAAPEDVAPLVARSLARDPQDYRTWRLSAALHARDRDLLGAAEAYAQALRVWPREAMDRGAPFEEAFRLMPLGVWWLDRLADAPAHWSVRLAWKSLELNDPETAWLACQQAGRIRPVAFRWIGACAEALDMQGRHAEASAYVDAWVAAEPGDPWAWVARHRLSPWTVRGRDALRTALALDARHPRIRRLGERWIDACSDGLRPPHPEGCTEVDAIRTAMGSTDDLP